MKKRFIYLFLAFVFIFSSCDDIIEKNTPENVFEVFWRTMDENYVFFEEKGIDWDSIYSVYAPQAQEAANDEDLKRIFSEIIPLFKDKHLSIMNTEKYGIRYINTEMDTIFHVFFGWEEDCGFKRKSFDVHIPYICSENTNKHIALVKINSFVDFNYYSDIAMEKNPVKVLDLLDFEKGLIIDLRNNSGGVRPNLYNLISAFYAGNKILSYEQYKIGKNHDQFSDKKPEIVSGQNLVPEYIPIIVLTSAMTYSAGNYAVYLLKDIRNCTIIGEATSGGGGGRKDVVLPNGWILSFPCNKAFSPNNRNMEYEHEPDVFVKSYYNMLVKDSTGNIIYRDTTLLTAIAELDKLNN